MFLKKLPIKHLLEKKIWSTSFKYRDSPRFHFTLLNQNQILGVSIQNKFAHVTLRSTRLEKSTESTSCLIIFLVLYFRKNSCQMISSKIKYFFPKFSSSQFLKCHSENDETCFQNPWYFSSIKKWKGSFFSLFRVVLKVPEEQPVTPTSHLWTNRDLHFPQVRTQNLLALTQP